MVFQGDPGGWNVTEYAIVLIILAVVWLIYKRLKRKPTPTGPSCKKCGIYNGVSQCMYCNDHYCQTHIFRQSHRCQDWMIDRTPLGGLQHTPKK